MKKQEAIEKLKKQLILNSEIVGSEFDKGYNHAIKIAIATVVKLDESEKAVLSKAEAEWLEGLKEAHPNLSKTQLAYFITRQGWGYLFEYKDDFEETKRVLNLKLYPNEIYPTDLKERLLNAVLYGYEVKKEKLYRVRNKLTNSYLYKIGKGWSHTWDKNQGKSLPKESWVELGVWDSEVYEREEV